MKEDFSALLGLPLAQAKQRLALQGCPEPVVEYTEAPVRPAGGFSRRSPEGEARGFSETRVVRVADHGRRLLVSRFLTAICTEEGETGHE